MSRTASHLPIDMPRPHEGLFSSPSTPSTVAHATASEYRLRMPLSDQDAIEKNGKAVVEILNSSELAVRLKVKESWVIEQSKRSRTVDPIPVLRLGKHRRYRWAHLR
jgi:hypothetical protein